MTLTTVSAPRGLANTSRRPRYGLSLKRTGALASSSDPNAMGALDFSNGATPRANATSSRVGALMRDTGRINPGVDEPPELPGALELDWDFTAGEVVGLLLWVPEVPAIIASSKPASSNLERSSFASSIELFVPAMM